MSNDIEQTAQADRKLLSPKRVAQLLDVAVPQVWALIRSGQLQAVDVTNRRRKRGKAKRHRPTWRVPVDAIEAFAAGETPGAPRRAPGRPRKLDVSHLPECY